MRATTEFRSAYENDNKFTYELAAERFCGTISSAESRSKPRTLTMTRQVSPLLIGLVVFASEGSLTHTSVAEAFQGSRDEKLEANVKL